MLECRLTVQFSGHFHRFLQCALDDMAANMEAPDDDTGFEHADDEPLEAYRFRFLRDDFCGTSEECLILIRVPCG